MEKIASTTNICQRLDQQALVEIVDVAQKRTVCEEVDLLLNNSATPTSWLMEQLGTNPNTGVQGSED